MLGLGKRKARLRRDRRLYDLSRCFVASRNELSVQRFVTLRGCVPRKIARHCPFHQPRPEAPVSKDSPRTLDCVPESLAEILVTEKTVTAVRHRIVIFDYFLDSTGHARHREDAILQVI